MDIFGRKAGSRAAAAGAADEFTAPERERIEALWRLTALPRAEFEATYGAMLGGFWRYAAGARARRGLPPRLRDRRTPRAPGARAAPLRRRLGRRSARRGHELRAIAEDGRTPGVGSCGRRPASSSRWEFARTRYAQSPDLSGSPLADPVAGVSENCWVIDRAASSRPGRSFSRATSEERELAND